MKDILVSYKNFFIKSNNLTIFKSFVPGCPGTKGFKNLQKNPRYPVLEHDFPVLEPFFVLEHPFLVLLCPIPVFGCPVLSRPGFWLSCPVLSLGKIFSLSRCRFVPGQ